MCHSLNCERLTAQKKKPLIVAIYLSAFSFDHTSTAVMRLSSKAGPGWDTETGVRTQPEIKQHVAGWVHKCENCDKCTSFLFRTSHVADSALRQVHVTMEKQTEKERLSHTDRLSPTGRRRKIKSESKVYRERGRGGLSVWFMGTFTASERCHLPSQFRISCV